MAKKFKLSNDRELFDSFFPGLVDDIVKENENDPETGEAARHMREVLEYNVPGGKKNRGLSVIGSLRHLISPDKLTETDEKNAIILGWCVEWLQAFFLVADDIMDESLTRRGKLCWYRKTGIGNIAVNDFLLIEATIYKLLKKHVYQEPYYVDVLNLFHEVTYQTATGQTLDLITKPGTNFENFTMERYMRGDRLVNSLYPMHMKRQVPRTVICSRRMTEADIRMLKEAIDQNYMFELFVGELPIDRPFGVVSTMGNEKDEQVTDRYFLVNYLDFIIGYNEKEVVSANVTRELNLEHLVDITEWKEGMVIQFSYSVQWTPLPHIIPSQALELQLKSTMPHGHQNMDIHWLAIINSFVLMLLILSLFLLIIIRVVRSDLSRYLQIPDEELNAVEEETGWKLLHADVFRAPKHRLFFCSAIGAGAQMTSMMIMVVLVGCIGAYYQRGAVASAAVISYMVTALLGGFVSANLYQKLGGEKWAWNIFMTALCFMGPAFLIWSFLNTVAIFYGSTAAFPFPTILLMFAMWACVTFPLTVLGGIIGRHRSLKQAQAEGSPFPCKTNKLAREIPSCRWYQSPVTQFFASGFLPFSAIYIELHYIFNSVWGPRIYFLYGILLLAFTMLLLVAGTVTVLFTYFHLNAEDHRWWWRSFGSGVAVSAFFYLYCIYFFLQTGMNGFLQCSFFFLYSLLAAHGIALMLGCVSFYCSYFFVIYIYSRIKAE